MKKLSLILCAAVFASAVNINVSAAGGEDTGIIYSQDFEDENVETENLGGSGSPKFSVEAYDEGGGFYGSFREDSMWRPGFSFDKDDVTSGKIKVSLDFHPVFQDGAVKQGAVVIGNSIPVSGLSPTKQTLSLLWINADGRISTAGRLGTSATYGGRELGVTAEDVWYTCEATLNLDTPAIDITVTDKETGDSFGRYSGNVNRRGSNEWEFWPIADTPFKNIAVIYDLDIDNIRVEQLAEQEYISADSIGLYLSGGAEETDMSAVDPKTASAKITFSEAMDESTLTSESVSLIDVDTGEAVEYMGSLDDTGCEYTMNFGKLNPNTSYKLVISADVASAGGKTMEKEKTLEFKTKEAEAELPPGVIFSEDFEASSPTVYEFSNGLGTKVTKDNMFDVGEEGGNRFGVFRKDLATAGNRIGFDLGKPLTEGLINIRFKFRAKTGTTTFFILGNEYTDKSQHNWLALLVARMNGSTRYLYAGTGHGGALFKADHVMKAPDGSDASITDDVWYSYSALLDIDNHDLQAVVTDADGNEVGSISLKNMQPHDASDNNLRFNGWPAKTDLKALASMFAADIDDITVEKVARTVAVSRIAYIDANGAESANATELTSAIRVIFNTAVSEDSLSGKVALDGNIVSGALLSDGKTYEIKLDSPLDVGTKHTVSIAAGVESASAGDTPSEEAQYTFTALDSKTVFYEDFEGETVAEYTGFTSNTSQCKAEVAGENGNRYIKITGDGGRAGYVFTPITDGRVKIHFRFMYDTVSRADNAAEGIHSTSYIRFGHEYGSTNRYLNDPLSLLMRNGYELRYGTSSNANTNRRLGNVRAKIWYNYDAIIDIDKHSIDITVDTAEGTKHVSAILPLRQNTDTTSSTGSGNMYQDWPNVNNFDQLSIYRSVNLDDIIIQRIYEKPALSAESITLRMADGAAQTDLEAVNPAVTAIDIDFGEKMDKSTLTPESVTLKNTETGESVSYIGSLDETGRVYTLSVPGLNGGCGYELSVSPTVQNVGGDALGESFSISFKTASGGFGGALVGLSASGAAITSLSGLTGKVTVNAPLVNSYDKDMSAAVYVLYYDDDDRLLGTQMQSAAVTAHTTKSFAPEFEINKPEGTTHVSVILWGADGMPLTSGIELR